MSAETANFANGPIMWAIALLTIGVVIVLALQIYRITRKYAEARKSMTPEEMKLALKTGGIVSIGPAISVFILAMTMISLVGAPATLMRVGIIGSATTEMTAASVGAQMAGAPLGKETLTLAAFGCAMFGCAVMSSGYLILIPIISRGLAKPLTSSLRRLSLAKKSASGPSSSVPCSPCCSSAFWPLPRLQTVLTMYWSWWFPPPLCSDLTHWPRRSSG